MIFFNRNGNQDVPEEEVKKVIETSEEEEDTEEVEEGYIDMTEEAAKKELDSMVIPGTLKEDDDSVSPNSNNFYESPIIKDKNVIPEVPRISLNLLQFTCEACKLKTYMNLDDDKVDPLTDKVKCPACGKKKSKRSRIFNVTINSFNEYSENYGEEEDEAED